MTLMQITAHVVERDGSLLAELSDEELREFFTLLCKEDIPQLPRTNWDHHRGDPDLN